MFSVSAERLLSMSAFEAAQVLRSFKQRNPGLLAQDAVKTVRAIRADVYALDYEAGLLLEAALPALLEEASDIFFRACIDAIIHMYRPLWMRLAPGGREQVMRAVPLNGSQCFRAAGLLETPPSPAIWSWWDDLAAQIRADRDAALVEQGREAEWWSYERENALVAAAGINRQPVWASIEDNSLGYDILSYRRSGITETSRLIEVKSSSSTPARMILTRNEWKTAERYGEALEFHLWVIPSRQLFIFDVDTVRRSIPTNRGNGNWLEVEITPSLSLADR